MPRRKKIPPYLDALDAEVREEIIDRVAKMLANRDTPAEIGRATSVPIEHRLAVISAGWERLVEWVGIPRSDPRFESLALCESVVRSNASVRERMAAQARIDELLGVESPGGIPSPPAQHNPPAINVTVNLAELTDDDLDRRIADLERRTARGAQGEEAPQVLARVSDDVPKLRDLQGAPGKDQSGP